MNEGQANKLHALLKSNTKFLNIRFNANLKRKKDSNGGKKQRMTWCSKISPVVHHKINI